MTDIADFDEDGICPKTGGEHLADFTAMTIADIPGVVDIPCVNCGRSGSAPIDADDINW